MRDICRWHVEEFAYLLGKLKSIPEGDGTLLDHTLLLYVHEHAEANSHKNNGMAAILAGHAGGVKTGMHSMLDRHGRRSLSDARRRSDGRADRQVPERDAEA